MTRRTASNEQDLTGVWRGLYAYLGGASVSFVATLIENGSLISGSTEEPGSGAGSPAATLYATLLGRHDAASISFTKTYEGGGASDLVPIAYEGTVSGDGTEIEGRWTIGPAWSGRFLMIRSSGKAEEVEREAFARV